MEVIIPLVVDNRRRLGFRRASWSSNSALIGVRSSIGLHRVSPAEDPVNSGEFQKFRFPAVSRQLRAVFRRLPVVFRRLLPVASTDRKGVVLGTLGTGSASPTHLRGRRGQRRWRLAGKSLKQSGGVVVWRSGRDGRRWPPFRSGRVTGWSLMLRRPPDHGGDGRRRRNRRRDQKLAAALCTTIPASRRPDWGRTWSGQHGDGVAELGGVGRRSGGGGARTGAARHEGLGVREKTSGLCVVANS